MNRCYWKAITGGLTFLQLLHCVPLTLGRLFGIVLFLRAVFRSHSVILSLNSAISALKGLPINFKMITSRLLLMKEDFPKGQVETMGIEDSVTVTGTAIVRQDRSRMINSFNHRSHCPEENLEDLCLISLPISQQ